MPTATKRRRPADGVSLVELVVVVMIMGIVTSIATPMYFHTLARGRVDAAARRLVADLALVQSTAEVSSSSRTIQFSSTGNSYVVAGLASPDRPTLDYSMQLSATPYFCDIVSVDCDGDEMLVFNGFGLPDSSATVTIASGHLQRLVVVDPITGKGVVQ